MLAEKKRKEKWCLNPMGNFWAKDENKFGQKMLEKMGWQPGTGLGSRGQGPTEIIKINVKNDTLGLGSKHDNQKEVWTKQLVDYDSLLAELNGDPKPEEREAKVLPSLEEKSKTSRARVHYHKFTRGKDVSKYSSKDLSCILPLHKIKEAEEANAGENNMYTYFNKKLNNPYKKNSDEASSNDALEEDISTVEKVDAALQDTLQKKRKKKKRKMSDLEDIGPNEEKTNTNKSKCSESKSKGSDTLFFENFENNCANTNSLVSNADESCIFLPEIDLSDKIKKNKKKKKHLEEIVRQFESA